MTMFLETERLILRDFVADDWEQVHVYASDADLVKFMDWGPNSENATKDYIDTMIQSQQQTPRAVYEFAMTLKENGFLIGGCGLHVEEHSQASLGYCLNRGFWGCGFASEAAYALCKVGFRELNVHRIFATCRPENIASAKVMEKIGMTKEGLLREHFYVKGKWQSSFLYSVLANEFR
jgi:ribosomal-protein-alanine N-acetyltransferase